MKKITNDVAATIQPGELEACLPRQDRLPETLKLDINAMLWQALPDTCTLGDAEKLACKIFDLIAEKY